MQFESIDLCNHSIRTQLGRHHFHGYESSSRRQWSCDTDQYHIKSSTYAPLQEIECQYLICRLGKKRGKKLSQQKDCPIGSPMQSSEMSGRQRRTTIDIGTQFAAEASNFSTYVITVLPVPASGGKHNSFRSTREHLRSPGHHNVRREP